MTPDRIRIVLQFYRLRLADVSGSGGKLSAERADTSSLRVSLSARARHLLWMLDETEKLVDEGRTEKAMRWLGFLQGVLWSLNLFSIDQLKTHNKPMTPEEQAAFFEELGEAAKIG